MYVTHELSINAQKDPVEDIIYHLHLSTYSSTELTAEANQDLISPK